MKVVHSAIPTARGHVKQDLVRKDSLGVVRLLDSSVRMRVICVAHKAEAAAPATVTIFDDGLRYSSQLRCFRGWKLCLTASSTLPNCSKCWRRALSSVCH